MEQPSDEKTYSQREVWTEVRLMKIEEGQKAILGEIKGLKDEVTKLNVRVSASERASTFGRGWLAGAVFVAGAVGALACEIFRRFF